MAKKKEKVTRSNDEVREIILQFFYDLHKNATSPKGMKLMISEVKSGLKERGLESKEIVSNLDYLIQSGFVDKEEEAYQVRKGKSIFSSKKTYYKASDKSINYFEGTSKFQKIEHSFAGINIENVQGMANIVIGDSNTVINNQYIELYKTLDLLSDSVRKSASLSDEDKLNYVGEVETIKSQLMKPKPDKNIVKQAWEKLKPLATVAGIVAFFERVAKLIGVLL